MAKKRRRTSVWLVKKQRAQAWLEQARSLLAEDHPESALATLHRLFKMVPDGSSECFEAANLMGVCWMYLDEVEQAYQAFTLALTGFPDAADILLHRGMPGRMTRRSLQSVLDFYKALAVAKEAGYEELSKLVLAQLQISYQAAKEEICLRGLDFATDRLIELQDLSARACHLVELEAFEEAVPILRRAIEMDLDVQPYDWADLGNCLLQLDQIEEAEKALKRALEIDPHYEYAQQCLEDIAKPRAEGAAIALVQQEATQATSAA